MCAITQNSKTPPSIPSHCPIRTHHTKEHRGEKGCPGYAESAVFTGNSEGSVTLTLVLLGKPRSAVQKFLLAISQNTVKKLGRGRSSSMEHLSAVHQHGSKLEKEPSLQSLRRASPFSQLRKASSVQSLPSLKRKPDRSISYLVGEPAAFSPSLSRGPRRSLSVEDVGDPSALRSVGRVAKAYPDGTLLLQLSRPSRGPFGFFISRGHGRADSGVYVQEMGDSSTEKLYAGLLGVGDEIVEVNGEKVSGLTLEQVNALMIQQDTASLRVLRQRRGQR
ncbi:UNVERIFIED_CONTAM: hypothetical protein FKN15_003058 [Acipenser sinensis]